MNYELKMIYYMTAGLKYETDCVSSSQGLIIRIYDPYGIFPIQIRIALLNTEK